MKKIIFPLLASFIFFTGYSASCQPMKGCDEIVITGVSFNDVAAKLLDAHFLIEKKDVELGTIKTERRDVDYQKQKGGFIILSVRVKDSTAFIRGTCGLDMSFANMGSLEYRVENKGGNGDIRKGAFKVMNEFALSFSMPVKYSITN